MVGTDSVENTKKLPPQTQNITLQLEPPCPSQTNNNNVNNNKKKRKLTDDVDLKNSAYFKIRTLLHQLRPHVMQVLRTPDFQNCKSAHEIQKGMKIVMDLYKQMQIEGTRKGNFQVSACQALSGEREPKKGKLDEESRQGKSPHDEQVSLQSVENKISLPPISSEEKFEDGDPQGTYIVGGSVSGWNFIIYGNRRPPVYYGVTKDLWRFSHNKSENGNMRSIEKLA